MKNIQIASLLLLAICLCGCDTIPTKPEQPLVVLSSFTTTNNTYRSIYRLYPEPNIIYKNGTVVRTNDVVGYFVNGTPIIVATNYGGYK